MASWWNRTSTTLIARWYLILTKKTFKNRNTIVWILYLYTLYREVVRNTERSQLVKEIRQSLKWVLAWQFVLKNEYGMAVLFETTISEWTSSSTTTSVVSQLLGIATIIIRIVIKTIIANHYDYSKWYPGQWQNVLRSCSRSQLQPMGSWEWRRRFPCESG